ncbi:ATPase, V1/A1 complex, subunit E [Tribonema minus]|uniref:ATPase, V1/A1 complex, subunit E n=1 Tax=Tribonema minus TaxID=303371 RepID=A0A835YLP4_9STRA|nr:ATPase, V1/A1 complex, subunit E [Tribonema minus]
MEAGSASQIRQMVNFILQEAHEKAVEIKLKTEHDFNLEKQMLVHNAKLKIQEEYVQKDKDRAVQDRIARSGMVGTSRVQKMTSRDQLLQTLLADTTATIDKVSHSADAYPKLLRTLLVQGLIKIEEDDVTVHVRTADVAAMKSVAADAVADYKAQMQKEANLAVTPTVTVNEDPAKCLSAASPGGLVLVAAAGRIVCDNQLAARLSIVYQDLLPKVRALLFPSA